MEGAELRSLSGSPPSSDNRMNSSTTSSMERSVEGELVLAMHDGTLLREARAEFMSDLNTSGALKLIEQMSNKIIIAWQLNDNILITDESSQDKEWALVDKIEGRQRTVPESKAFNTKSDAPAAKPRRVEVPVNELKCVKVLCKGQMIQFVKKTDVVHSSYFFQHGNVDLLVRELQMHNVVSLATGTRNVFNVLDPDERRLKKTFEALQIDDMKTSGGWLTNLVWKNMEFFAKVSDYVAPIHQTSPENRSEDYEFLNHQEKSDPETKKEEQTPRKEVINPVAKPMSTLPPRKTVFWASCSGAVYIYDMNPKKRIFKSSDFLNAPYRDLCTSPSTPDVLLSVGYDNVLHIFDTRRKLSPLQVRGNHPLSSVCVSNCGRFCVTGNFKGELISYDLRNFTEMLQSNQVHDSAVIRVEYLANEESSFNVSNLDSTPSILCETPNLPPADENQGKVRRDSFFDFINTQSLRGRETLSRRDSFNRQGFERRNYDLDSRTSLDKRQSMDPKLSLDKRLNPVGNAKILIAKTPMDTEVTTIPDTEVMMKITTFLAVICIAVCVGEPQRKQTRQAPNKPGRFLSLPVPEKCANRPKEFTYKGKNLFLSTHVPALANRKVDWLDGRNVCREYCMDLVSLETQEKNNLIFRVIQQNDVPYIWTSGRICDFAGCENRPDLEPKNIFGWFWSSTREKIQPTNRIAQGWGYNPWSQTGHKKIPQPDNAEYDINQTKEQCLSVLNNVYNDGIAWHDVACYHEKPVICEDSDELLQYVAATNPGIRL